MNYIVFDMEWNQPVCREKTILSPFPLRGEIFQIGAVKLSEDGEYLDGLNLIIKPVYYKRLNRRVAKIVGVDNETISAGEPFEKAINDFRRWCGEEFLFFTWGFDDMPMLYDNLRLHKMDTDWLPDSYNLQIMFNHQICDGETKVCSLESTLEKMEIEPDEQFHDAFNDALYTSTVLSRLDIKRGIEEYSADIAASESYSWSNTTENCGYKSIELAMADPLVSGFTCPECGCEMQSDAGWINQRDHRKIAVAKCSEHGEYFFKLRLKKLAEENYMARRNVCQLSDTLRVYYDEKKRLHDEAQNKKSTHRRRRRTRRRRAAEAPSEPVTVADTNENN
jgi:DNA polymerase III epsilon subunit-like protein